MTTPYYTEPKIFQVNLRRNITKSMRGLALFSHILLTLANQPMAKRPVTIVPPLLFHCGQDLVSFSVIKRWCVIFCGSQSNYSFYDPFQKDTEHSAWRNHRYPFYQHFVNAFNTKKSLSLPFSLSLSNVCDTILCKDWKVGGRDGG